MKNHTIFIKTKKAFSLIEVIFVLVILGIVASISSQIIVQVYENYITQRAVYNVSTKTELVSNQIVNRLTYRMQGSTISKKHQVFLDNQILIGAPAIQDDDWLPLSDIPSGTEYTSIEWIGYDNDSFSATQNPSWSGISDYETATVSTFDSPGSNLSDTATIMSNLSNGKVLFTAASPAALIFSENNNFYSDTNEYNQICMGLIPEDGDSNTDCIFRVARNGNTGFTFLDNKAKIVTERYKLAWSAYAIAPEDRDGDLNGDGVDDDGLYDLVLYSNYQPWNGENYIQHGTKNILMPNVTVFKFSETAGVIRFKLCASENIGQDFNVTTCKEKVVIR